MNCASLPSPGFQPQAKCGWMVLVQWSSVCPAPSLDSVGGDPPGGSAPGGGGRGSGSSSLELLENIFALVTRFI